jgi:SWI/SNF-related matrix-associated actin-dependent regulator of chromatin subfamily D
LNRKYAKPPLPPPHVLQTLVPDSPAFVDLIKAEQKLDWTLLRKKAEINDTLGRPVRVRLLPSTDGLTESYADEQVKRTLRVFLSNTAHDQTWQKEHDLKEKAAAAEAQEAETGVKAEEKPVDINQGKGIPGWVLRVEGRLIDVSIAWSA